LAYTTLDFYTLRAVVLSTRVIYITTDGVVYCLDK